MENNDDLPNGDSACFTASDISDIIEIVLPGVPVSEEAVLYLQDYMNKTFKRIVLRANDFRVESGKEMIEAEHIDAAIKDIESFNITKAICGLVLDTINTVGLPDVNNVENRRDFLDRAAEHLGITPAQKEAIDSYFNE